jgi:Mg-chelatase subunit ChlD
MKIKLLGIALFAMTVASVTYYPQLMATTTSSLPPKPGHTVTTDKPRIDVVFVLDTTGSMEGLIAAAKEKIWSIATTMSSAQQSPDIRIGLVGYRDRGDDYVTKIVDLSADLDSVYASLMDFQAAGGGDTPESVNKALYDAVHNMAWSQQDNAYQVIFLVGDAPPHMDYNEVRYPEIIASANDKGIVVNAIQCGEIPAAIEPWTRIANLGQGAFFQVEQAGGAVAYATPFDKKIAELSARVDDTRLYFGDAEEKEAMHRKVMATNKLHDGASDATRARRGVFNATLSGRTNLLGTNELVAAVESGEVDLADLDQALLPESVASLAPEKRQTFVAAVFAKRTDLQERIEALSVQRSSYIEKKVDEAGGERESLDQKLYDAVKDQASSIGLEYENGPAY